MTAVIVDSNVIALVGLSVMSLCMRKYRAHLQSSAVYFPTSLSPQRWKDAPEASIQSCESAQLLDSHLNLIWKDVYFGSETFIDSFNHLGP